MYSDIPTAEATSVNSGDGLSVEIDAPVGDTLESAGVGITLFGRLLDECDPDRLRELVETPEASADAGDNPT